MVSFSMFNSAKNTWKFHRYSTIALIPMIAYLFFKIIQFSHMTYDQILLDLNSTWSILFILIFTVLGLFHMYTGVHEIMEDYIHDETTKRVSEILVLIFLSGIFSMTCLSLGLIILS